MGRRESWTGWIAATTCGVLLAGAGTAMAQPDPADLAASVASDVDRACVTSRVPVSLEQSTPATPSGPGLSTGELIEAMHGQQEVVARLCLPLDEDGTPRLVDAVQLLVHGITYTHRYWNIADPDDPDGQQYSWEHAAIMAGYATVAIDRIGNGDATRPMSVFVDQVSNAAAVRDVVAALRAGEIPGPDGLEPAFGRVVLVGHSYGSMTGWMVADRYGGVDALVLTGATHNVREVVAPVTIETSHYPAILDPMWADSGLDPGYVVSMPGTRRELFYSPGTDVDDRIIARDEATKGTFSQFEVYNYPIIFRTQLDLDIPIFLLIGTLDGIFCSQDPLDLAADCSSEDALISNEAPWFGPDVPCLDAHVTVGAGHNLNAFRSSQESFAAAHHWLTRVAPADTSLDVDCTRGAAADDPAPAPDPDSSLPTPALPATGGGVALLGAMMLFLGTAARPLDRRVRDSRRHR